MFKIICDVSLIDLNIITKALTEAGLLQKNNLARAAVKYKKAIRYDNCIACDISNFKLTSTGKAVSKLEVSKVLNIWSNNFLNPENYHNSYAKILSEHSSDSFDIKHFKYVSIFEKDTGLWQQMPDALEVVQVFETIIDSTRDKRFLSLSTVGDYYNTGYEEYHHKSSFIKLTNTTKDTFITLWALNVTDNGQYYIHNHLTPYILRHKGTLDCPEIKYHAANDREVDIEGYIQFLEKDFVEQFSMGLSFLRHCQIGDQSMLFVDPIFTQESSTIDHIQTVCAEMDGKLTSMRDTIEKRCQEKGIEYQLYNGPPTVTCNDYDTLISFDAAGEILRAELGGELTLRALAQQHHSHTEL